MADNKRRGRFGKASQDDDANQSIFDLFEPPPDQDDTTSFGKIPVIRDEDSIDLTDASFVESQVSAEAEAAGLAHWTEPPTGQIPASLGANQSDGEVKGPSWRGEDPNWEGPDLADVFADTDAITHDRIIDLDDDELLGAAPPPSRPAPVHRPATAESAPSQSAARPPVPAASVFDTPPGSSPISVQDPGQAPAPASAVTGRTAREGVAAAPQRAQTGSAPTQPPAAAPRRIVDDSPARSAPQLRESQGRAVVPPPAHQALPVGANGQRNQPPDPRGRPITAPPRQRPDATEPTLRRGAHDLGSNHPGEDDPIELLDVEFASPAPTGQTALPPRGERPGNGAVDDDYDERVHQQGLLDPEDEDDYDDYDDYDDDDEGRSLVQSVLVGIAIAAVVFVTLGFGPVPTMVLVGLLTLVAVMELFNAMRLAGLRPATLLGLVGAVALPAASYVRGDAGFPLVMGLAIVFGMLWYLTGADTERPVLNLGLTFMGILWIGGLAGFGALMVRAEDGVGLLLATIILAAASDTFAYLGGRAYGTKSFHSASPNKTWEGTITGFFGALFAGLAIGVTNLIGVFDDQFVPVMVLAAVVGVLAPIGDLAESLVKRDLGVKDMGTLLPGHGGILDRVDGLLFALPGAYYVAVVYSLI